MTRQVNTSRHVSTPSHTSERVVDTLDTRARTATRARASAIPAAERAMDIRANPAPRPIAGSQIALPWSNYAAREAFDRRQGEGMVLKHVRCNEIRADSGAVQETNAGLESLVESIRHHGMLRPVLLRSTEDGYVIVHGERRWRAARVIGMERIPAFLVDELKSEATLEV
jgi:hypothetical protein